MTLRLSGHSLIRSSRVLQRNPSLHFQPRCWCRHDSHAASSLKKIPSSSQNAFWTTSRTLLFSTFASSLAYAYGVNDAGSWFRDLAQERSIPKYGSTKEFIKVILSLGSQLATHISRPRQLANCAELWARTLSALTMRTSMPTASRNGRASILIDFRSPLHILNPRKTFPRLQRYATSTACQ